MQEAVFLRLPLVLEADQKLVTMSLHLVEGKLEGPATINSETREPAVVRRWRPE